MFSALLNSRGRNAKIAVALGAAIWGLYWIPLRALDEAGITGAWATFLYYLGPLILWLPIALARARRLATGRAGLWLTGFPIALSMVLYANALIFTEVVRAVLLFYLTPIWSTVLAHYVLGDPITRLRWISIGLGFAGLFVILGVDQGIPLPGNLGDWLALVAGLAWAAAAVRLRQDRANEAEEITFGYLLLGTLIALIACAFPDGRTGPLPALETVFQVLPWLVPVLLIIVIPSSFLIVWGARLLNPGLVGVLFMTEISVGAGSAALLADEPFGLREILGVLLISSAGLLESIAPESSASKVK